MPTIEHSVARPAFACGVPGYSICGCGDQPFVSFQHRNSHGWGATLQRIAVAGSDGRFVVELTYRDGTLPADLATRLGSLAVSGMGPEGHDLIIHALPHVARRLGNMDPICPNCALLGGACVVAACSALDACDMVRARVQNGTLDVPALEGALVAILRKWEGDFPPETTPPYGCDDEDRDYAVTTWRTPDGEWHARSGEAEAHAATLPDAVAALFHSMEAP